MKSYFDAKPFHQKLCLNLSNDIQDAILKNAIKFYINAKKENLFFFSNKQILIIQEGALMTIRRNNEGKQIGVDILKKGDLLGILNFGKQSPQDFISVLPLTDVFGWLISKDTFEHLLSQYIELDKFIIHYLSERFYRIIRHLTNLVCDTSKERIEYSLKLSHQYLGDFYLTQEQIALLSGLNRVTVAKIFKDIDFKFD
ncbi:Crp/Fnr family transcriptional regulator [Phascolarctobacterium sp.]|nr:Crp/Fnr family transcriptional regulator [Acidaminococcaceae bacterium]